MQAYSDPRRESDPHALPDVETFYHAHKADTGVQACIEETCQGTGWYWWTCFPGCLPDSDPIGPFDTEAAALADAQEATLDDNTTTCATCGQDFPDRDMLPRPDGDGETCPKCTLDAQENAQGED